MTDEATTGTEFVAEGATIATNRRILAKLGRVEVRDGHIGLFRENGDLIASGPVADALLKKSLLYFTMPTILVTVDGQKFRVNLCYERLISTGHVDDQSARDQQREENEEFFDTIRRLGGRGA